MSHLRLTPTPAVRTGLLALTCILGLTLLASLPAAAGEEPRKVEGDVVAPRVVHKVQPQYPEEARKEKVTGAVILQAIIDTEGRVTDVEILQSVREDIDAAAGDAIRQWQFEPATLEGEPVAVYYNLTVNFRLKDKPEEN